MSYYEEGSIKCTSDCLSLVYHDSVWFIMIKVLAVKVRRNRVEMKRHFSSISIGI